MPVTVVIVEIVALAIIGTPAMDFPVDQTAHTTTICPLANTITLDPAKCVMRRREWLAIMVGQ